MAALMGAEPVGAEPMGGAVDHHVEHQTGAGWVDALNLVDALDMAYWISKAASTVENIYISGPFRQPDPIPTDFSDSGDEWEADVYLCRYVMLPVLKRLVFDVPDLIFTDRLCNRAPCIKYFEGDVQGYLKQRTEEFTGIHTRVLSTIRSTPIDLIEGMAVLKCYQIDEWKIGGYVNPFTCYFMSLLAYGAESLWPMNRTKFSIGGVRGIVPEQHSSYVLQILSSLSATRPEWFHSQALVTSSSIEDDSYWSQLDVILSMFLFNGKIKAADAQAIFNFIKPIMSKPPPVTA